jgi:hypothetical protein
MCEGEPTVLEKRRERFDPPLYGKESTKMKSSMRALFLVILLGSISNSEAALVDYGNGMIYDTDRNITWLKDANYAITSGYDADGLMSWNQAVAWVGQLSYGGYDDWRLPTALNPDGSQPGILNPNGGYNYASPSPSYNNTGSEVGHLFYQELGNLGQEAPDGSSPQPNWGLKKTGSFTNFQARKVYWTGTTLGPYPGWSYDLYAYEFSFHDGQMTLSNKEDIYNMVWPVRDGAPTNVPVPGTIWLLGSGLVGLVGFKKLKKNKRD